ncbi:Type 1 glutamine amidotransferase-like domain-containing protein [Floccifex sp.]|uniref:Type 1 glutamine amidotransferase-like domain-containing protein n=1 Tax=Floccifex sp. TaxID=2815810 RepID=UPI003F05B234
MRHILLSDYNFDQNWAYPTLKKYISKEDKVCICALTFFEDNEEDWNRQFKKGQGYLYRAYQDVFYKYGIQDISWIEYYKDSIQEMIQKINNSTILYIPGGSPDIFMKRIKQCRLKKILKNYQGTILGVSAGAMVQLEAYHISPDEDYKEFGYYTGLGYLSGFDIEVHYQLRNQKWIDKVIKEKHIPVYAITEKGGIVIDKNMECFGKVEEFR